MQGVLGCDAWPCRQMFTVMYVNTCLLQLQMAGLQKNLLSGTLPSSWAGLIEASQLDKTLLLKL